LFVAIQSVVRPNDEIIVFDPAYDAYDPAIRLAGGKAVHLQLAAPSFEIDWQKVADAITPRTRAIIINSPHNPTGAVITADDLKQLERLIESTPIYIISDEVYEHMTFNGRTHQSLSRRTALRERAFVISSFGKTYHATGWKVGYCLAPEALSLEFRKIHQFVTFTTHTPSQWAIADFLENCPEHHEKLSAFYEKKRDLFIDAIAELGFSLSPSGGTYFQLAGYDELSKESDQSFVNALTKEVGVAAIPVSVFYESPPEQNFIRFCFAKEDKTLLQAAEKLRKYFS
jgi:methionine aminotransferase